MECLQAKFKVQIILCSPFLLCKKKFSHYYLMWQPSPTLGESISQT